MKREDINNFGRIGVVMGGFSSERSISIKSGNAVCNALNSCGADSLAIELNSQEPERIKEILKDNDVDVCFIAMHGRFGEDGSLQKILEDLNIPYTCSGVRASRLAMDKIASREIFKKNGLYTPKYVVINKDFINPPKNLSFPVVVKPTNSGSSVGLSIVENKDQLQSAIEEAFLHDDKVIIEEYIAGRELTVGILNEEALPTIEIIPKQRFFNYQAKYTPGLTEYIVPAKLNKKLADTISKAALIAHKSLNCSSCSRVDIILNKKDLNPYILEVNSIPGFTDISLLPKAAKYKGIDFSELCLELVESALTHLKTSYNEKEVRMSDYTR